MTEGQAGDKAIENALTEHENGNITIEQVQRLTNMNLNIKYRAENECQEYRRELSVLNLMLSKHQDDFKPILSRIQQGEESRINFLKYNFEKLMKFFKVHGQGLLDTTEEMQLQVKMINSETDIRIFIDEHRSGHDFITKEEFQPYVAHEI